MAIIECDECGKSISDKAPMCVNCGFPLSNDTNNGWKSAISKMKDGAVNYAKEFNKSQQEKDAEAIEKLVQESNANNDSATSNKSTKIAKFKAQLENTIDIKFAEIMRCKEKEELFLTYPDGLILTNTVRNVFKNALDLTPPQVEAACSFCEAILAPSAQQRINTLKTIVGTAGGITGIGMIITGIGSALGWGAGVIATVTSIFTGSSFLGPVGLGAAGLGITGIAAYFAVSSNSAVKTERFIKALKNSVNRAVDAIWDEHGDTLMQVITPKEDKAESLK